MSKPFDKEVEKFRILIYGVSGNTEIKQRIAPVYTEERLAEGIELYTRTYEAGKKQINEQGESMAATRLYNQHKDEVHDEFMRVRKVLRYFFKEDTNLMNELKINVQVPTNFAQWRTLIDITLSAIMARQDVMEKVALLGISAEFVNHLSSKLPELEELRIAAEKEDGEAQEATETKNQLYDELRAYYSDLRECLGLFFEGSERQKLEQVGITVK